MKENENHGDNDRNQSDDAPVTSIIRRRVREGYEADFDEWQKGISSACKAFKGYVGVRFIRPEHRGNEYVTIISFDSYSHYLIWESSPERTVWLHRVRDMMEGEETREFIRGFDYWLGNDPEEGRSWPPDFRMIVIAFFAIWPLVYFVSPLLARFTPADPLLASLLSTAVITLLMGYISLPLMSRIARRWVLKK
jgi:antibiotic biosynthesis monooxygenase (ABM) superfamily enzyme